MPFDINSAMPVKENESGIEELTFGFDLSSAQPVSIPEEITFKALDSSNIFIQTAKDLFAGIETIPAIPGYAMEFLGRDIIAETKAPTIPIVPFPGIKSIPWLRRPKPKPNKIDTAIDNFFIKFGNTLAEIGKVSKDFYKNAADKGIESPNPAIMFGWNHPFKKTISLAARNFPMLGLAAGVTAVTKEPTIGAAIFFPQIAGDMYEDSIKNGVDPLRATDLAVIDGAVQTALETIVLGNWMKGGHILKRVFRTALQEGLIEEGTQQVFENSLKVLNWKDGRPVVDRLLDGMAESILAGAVSGGALGVFQAPGIDDIRYDLHNEVTQEGLKQGLTEDEISQTIDKVDEVIDKTIGIEPVTPPVEEVTPTGEGEVVLNLVRNPEKSPYLGERFGQDVEPTGFYAIEKPSVGTPEGWIEKQVTFNKPLYIDINKPEDVIGWKRDLSKKYGGLKGKKLTEALLKDGYDGIITVRKEAKDYYGSFGEIIALKEPPVKLPTPTGQKPKVKTRQPKTLIGWVIKRGGLDPQKLAKDYNIQEWKEEGLLSTLRKGGTSIDDLAQTAISEGIIPPPPETTTPGNWLKTKLIENKGELLDKIQAEYGIIEKEIKAQITKELENEEPLTPDEIRELERDAEKEIQDEEDSESFEEISKFFEEKVIPPETPPTAAYAIAPGEESPTERVARGRGQPKYIPPITAIGQMEWEKTEAWKVNLGRDIAGVFEREIGPQLQVSKRLKRFLGVYYPTLGPSGLIRVKTLADEMTLFHEAGHFLDDSLSGMTGWNVGQRGIAREELLKVTHYVTPFEEKRVPIIDSETGLPKRSKKTGEILTKFDTYTNYRRESKELFAQYLALYVNDPAKAKELAPTFTLIVEQEITKDKEFAYIVTKLREFEAQMKPIKDYVNALRKIPEFDKDIKDWVEKGNILQQLWRNKVGDKVWDIYSKAIENLGKKLHATAFFEKGGLNDAVFEVLRQRRKLIQGQQQRLKEELIEPISELGKEDQQFIAESLQRFELLEPDNPINKLTEEARRELSLWGNEARKLGLLNDEIFWNNIGQYFPFFYETKEFEKNKRNFGYFPSKAIRANFAALKHKLTDEEFGRRVLEAQLGTWPSSKEKIAKYSKEELESIGQNAREELGLMKTAAYPLQRRLFGMIEMIYTVKAFNTIGTLPGITGMRGMEGYDKMPESKKYGVLSGQYVSTDLVKEVSKWNAMQSEFGKFWRDANSVWKMFKVPYNPAAVSRNIITNAIMAYFGDVPVYNPVVAVKGIKSFIARDDAYKILRDRGLYHNTYSEQELKALAFQVDEDPDNPYKQLQIWANNLAQAIHSPAYLYGAIEDASKTVIARYVLDKGGTPEQAVKFADKLLFDYSQVSEVVGYARQTFLPFVTWSAKILPRMVEFAIRKPEKFALVIVSTMILNAISRSMLGIDKDDEERLKPDYIRGKTVLLLPERDINGDLNWVDLTYFLPWGNWIPIDRGKLAVPSTLTMSGVLPILYNAFVLNYDPFTDRKIAEDYLSEDEKIIEQGKYILKNLSPQILTTMLSGKLITAKPDKYGREKELSKILAGELLGVRFTADISAYRQKVRGGLKRDFYEGRTDIRKKLKRGELTEEQAREKIEKLKKRFKIEKERH